MIIEVVDPDEHAARGAEVLAAVLQSAVDERGRASLALSGGGTADELLDALARAPVPWHAVDVFQVDERVAPPGDPERNLTALHRRLVGRVDLAAGRVHPMPVEREDLDAAARAYADLLRGLAGDPPRLDVVHLGLGADGHTASLVPGSPVVRLRDRLVAVTEPYHGNRRMTLTLPALAGAGQLLWFVRGSGKAEVVRRLVDHDTSIPAGMVPRQGARLLLDHAAAAEL